MTPIAANENHWIAYCMWFTWSGAGGWGRAGVPGGGGGLRLRLDPARLQLVRRRTGRYAARSTRGRSEPRPPLVTASWALSGLDGARCRARPRRRTAAARSTSSELPTAADPAAVDDAPRSPSASTRRGQDVDAVLALVDLVAQQHVCAGSKRPDASHATRRRDVGRDTSGAGAAYAARASRTSDVCGRCGRVARIRAR